MRIWPFNKALISFLLLFASLASAADKEVYWRKDNSKEASSSTHPKEVLLREERYIDTQKSATDFDALDYYTGADSFAGEFSYAMGTAGQSTLKVQLKKELDDYAKHWVILSFSSTSGSFDALTENLSGTPTNNNSDRAASNQRPDDAEQTHSSYGIGYGHRFRFLADMFESSELFETVGFVISMNNLDESYLAASYSGYGLETSYSIEQRLNSVFYWSAQMTYHMASVTRPAINQEPKGERTLSLGWLNFGLAIGFYF